MKAYWDYFFRLEEDGVRFKNFSLTHIVIVFFIFFCCYLIYKNRFEIRKDMKLNRGLRIFLIGLILIQQFIFYYFFLANAYYSIKDLLPLYTCRVALLAGLFALIFSSYKLKAINIYWGSIGGIIPLIVTDIMPYNFPHAMFISFFMTHAAILWTAAIFIFVDNYSFSAGDLKFMYYVANFQILFSLVLNDVLGANYAYLNESPIFTEYFASIPRILYLILVFAIYNLLIYIVYTIGNLWIKNGNRFKNIDNAEIIEG
ncbi:TMEM164-related integral membrane acyltransferase [Peptoniphilus raoultii]|uniref:TMEM164-related integral membrane acyltransferase n=1 Tax=Peptoniphilus raoultii TaxID=1776387 RepID=UPI0008DA22AC|nr:TIGR02206 family membrane protein [Peptoniphilus raoultii]